MSTRRLISIQGGGIRGIIPCMALAKLEALWTLTEEMRKLMTS